MSVDISSAITTHNAIFYFFSYMMIVLGSGVYPDNFEIESYVSYS